MNKHDKSSLRDIADKTAGQDGFHVFESLISLGKSCVEKAAENRPEMVVVYTNLQNVMFSNICTQQTKGKIVYFTHRLIQQLRLLIITYLHNIYIFRDFSVVCRN